MRAHYDVASRVYEYLRVLAIVMLLSLIIAAYASSALQVSLTGPLDAMAIVARRIAREQDYSLRAETRATGEVGLVVDVFNRMLAEVQSHTQALEASNLALQEEVSDRVAAELALRASERLYRAIGESIDYGVWICDAKGRNVYASESFLRLVGITQEQCSELGWANCLHPDDAEATIAAWRECVASGQSWYREQRLLGADGRYHPILAQGAPIRDDQGRLSGWAGINLDIGRIKRTEDALRDADHRKDEFLATLAHELRNPLAPIRHAVRILDSRGARDQQRIWAREVIGRQVKQMALLLDDLLDVSRITRGQLEVKKEPVQLEAVINVARETVAPLIESNRHSLVLDVPPVDCTIEVDPLRLSQVLANLLNNAAKYTDPGGTITLTVVMDGRDLEVSVRDTGIGLAADAIPGIFSMFSQVKAAIDRAEGGLGIGLALVKGLVTLHGGTIVASSAGLGKGSEFAIHLPNAIVTSGAASESSPLRPEVTTPPSGTVLVVDDNRDAATSLATLLGLVGYKVSVAFSGAEALAIFAKEEPDAVLLDIGMPGMNGYEIARRIRLLPGGGKALLMAVTGWGQEGDKQLAVEAGFDHHFTKPVDLTEIEKVLSDSAGTFGSTHDAG